MEKDFAWTILRLLREIRKTLDVQTRSRPLQQHAQPSDSVSDNPQCRAISKLDSDIETRERELTLSAAAFEALSLGQRESSLQRRWKFWLSLASTFFVGLSVILVFFQLRSMNESLAEMQKQSKNSQTEAQAAADSLKLARARVHFDEMQGFAEEEEGEAASQRLVLYAKWTNYGATPTRHAHVGVVFAMGETDPLGVAKALARRVQRHSTVVLGPNGNVLAGEVIVPAEIVRRVRDSKDKMVVLGWVTYLDVFEDDVAHVTLFCQETTEIGRSTPIGGGRSQIELTWRNCTRYNCSDQECGDPSSLVKALSPPDTSKWINPY